MGARPSSFRKGGGFLDGVDVVISDYQFTDQFNGEDFKPGKIKGNDGKPMDKPHTLNVLLSVRVDGAEEDTITTLKAASNFDEWKVSEDGHTITPVTKGQNLAAGTSFAKLISSLCAAGFDENLLPEDDINYEAIIGQRVRLVQRVDEERTKKYGLKKDKKSGKSYERKDLVVDQVYGAVAAAPKAAGKTTAKTTAKPAAGKSVAGKKVAAAPVVDIEQLSKDTLVEIATEAGGSIQKSKLSMKVLTKLMKHDNREDVRKLIFTDEFLSLEDGWTYNKAKGIVEVVVEEEAAS